MKMIVLVISILTSFQALAQKKLQLLTIVHAANFSAENPTQISPLNSAYSDAARMAIAEYEKRFAKLGYEIRVLNLDYGNSDSEAVKMAEAAVSSEGLAAVGFYQSSKAIAAAPVLVKAGMQLIAPTSSALKLYEFGPLIRTLAISNRQIAQQVVKITKDRVRAKKALMVVESDCTYCLDLAGEIKSALAQSQITFREGMISSTATDMSEILRLARSESFDVLVLPNQEATTVKIAKFLQDNGMRLPMVGGDGWGNNITSKYFEIFKDPKFEAYSIGHWAPSKGNAHGKKFAKEWLNRFYREPTNVWAMVYEGTHFLLQAMLEMIEAKTPLTRENIAKKISSIKEYQGIVSRYVFEGPGSPPKRSVVILKANVKKKRFDPIELVWVD